MLIDGGDTEEVDGGASDALLFPLQCELSISLLSYSHAHITLQTTSSRVSKGFSTPLFTRDQSLHLIIEPISNFEVSSITLSLTPPPYHKLPPPTLGSLSHSPLSLPFLRDRDLDFRDLLFSRSVPSPPHPPPEPRTTFSFTPRHRPPTTTIVMAADAPPSQATQRGSASGSAVGIISAHNPTGCTPDELFYHVVGSWPGPELGYPADHSDNGPGASGSASTGYDATSADLDDSNSASRAKKRRKVQRRAKVSEIWFPRAELAFCTCEYLALDPFAYGRLADCIVRCRQHPSQW